jgi:MSHA biogenesis protein MshP
MCLNQSSSFVRMQRGSALVVAVFIIIVMVLLIGSLSQQLTSSSESVSYEVLGTRAFLAAQSGMERGLQILYGLDAVTQTTCPASLFFQDFEVSAIDGLRQCQVQVSCTAATSTLDPAITHFYLTSTGTCGDAASIQTSRTIEMEVWQ